MRINRDTLLKIANDTVAQRTRQSRGIVSVYLTGALLGEDYLLGGAADIDLVFVHIDEPAEPREVVRLTDEIHLDIAHYPQKEFMQPRSLRLHPWLGPVLFECKVLYDPQHFLDFTQASVRGQFHRPENVMRRARPQAEHARQIWMSFYTRPPEQVGPEQIALYLRSVDHAVNAVASLSGSPLTERRFLLNFPTRAEAVGRPGLFPGLMGIIGAPNVELQKLGEMLPQWQAALEALPAENVPDRLHPYRIPYYRKAFDALLGSDQPYTLLWPLLRTWTQAAALLPENHPVRQDWRAAGLQLGLLDHDFSEKVEALDAFLDMVEETLENWARQNGV